MSSIPQAPASRPALPPPAPKPNFQPMQLGRNSNIPTVRPPAPKMSAPLPAAKPNFQPMHLGKTGSWLDELNKEASIMQGPQATAMYQPPKQPKTPTSPLLPKNMPMINNTSLAPTTVGNLTRTFSGSRAHTGFGG